jgi:hypothetical protein
MKFLIPFVCSVMALAGATTSATTTAPDATTPPKHRKKTVHKAVNKAAQKKAVDPAPAVVSTVAAKKPAARKVYVQTWDEPTYKDSTIGDKVDGEDLEVRRAAVDALGQFNGSIVVTEPNTGRVLTMVNQQLALGGGFQPCSTV